jgi:ParB family chromosome partitioning protein
MAEEARQRLGRGLAALLGDMGTSEAATIPARQKKVAIEFVRANPRNPRKSFDEEELEDLAASIKEKGILQPILVRPMPKMADVYEIIAGERRWRAAQKAGLEEVPVIVIEADDKQALELSIIENVQRTDLNPMEEAAGYERLSEEFAYTQNDLAKVIGKSRSHVTNTLRLLKLPERTKSLVAEGKVSSGHARALLALPQPDELAERIVNEGLSVRDVERIALEADHGQTGQHVPRPRAPATNPAEFKSPDSQDLAKALMKSLGLKVSISLRAKGCGELKIAFDTNEELEAISARLR